MVDRCWFLVDIELQIISERTWGNFTVVVVIVVHGPASPCHWKPRGQAPAATTNKGEFNIPCPFCKHRGFYAGLK